MRCLFVGLCAAWSVAWTVTPLRAERFGADPSNYQSLVRQLKAGDTLSLAPGRYPRLYLANLKGTPEAWITITGPASEPPAVIHGAAGFNSIEIENCSFVSIENLRIDSLGIPGVFGISAKGREYNLTHHIRLSLIHI